MARCSALPVRQDVRLHRLVESVLKLMFLLTDMLLFHVQCIMGEIHNRSASETTLYAPLKITVTISFQNYSQCILYIQMSNLLNLSK